MRVICVPYIMHRVQKCSCRTDFICCTSLCLIVLLFIAIEYYYSYNICVYMLNSPLANLQKCPVGVYTIQIIYIIQVENYSTSEYNTIRYIQVYKCVDKRLLTHGSMYEIKISYDITLKMYRYMQKRVLCLLERSFLTIL